MGADSSILGHGEGASELDFCRGGPGQSAGVSGCGHRGCRVGVRSARPDQPAAWATSWGHCLSREEYDFLFSAGDFDCDQCCGFCFDVLHWEVAQVVLRSWFSVLS
jgi:hypothetical protein